MREFYFWIVRHPGGRCEQVTVTARSSGEAVNMLPPCVLWDWSI